MKSKFVKWSLVILGIIMSAVYVVMFFTIFIKYEEGFIVLLSSIIGLFLMSIMYILLVSIVFRINQIMDMKYMDMK